MGNESDDLLSDDAIDGSALAPDLLGRTTYARAAAAAIERIAVESESTVLGLIGPWGAGKSSVLNLIQAELEAATPGHADKPWSVVRFNPWYYDDLSSLQTGFFNELAESAPEGERFANIRAALGGLLKTVAPLGSVASLIGLDAQGIVALAGGLLSPERSVLMKKLAAEKALREAGRPFLMIVDDLDRLSPDELLMMFKLIRLTGRLPHVYYLISYDEQTLLDVLTRTGLVGTDGGRRAQDYMEKIVQVRLDLPPFRNYQVDTMFNRAIEKIAERHTVALTDDDRARFNAAYNRHLRSRFQTPRALRRYFVQVDIFLSELKEEVDLIDFLFLTWLRTAEPQTYSMLVRSRDELLGKNSIASLGSDPMGDAEPAKVRWTKRLIEAGVAEDNLAGVAHVLGAMFPRWFDMWSGHGPRRESERQVGRIANPDYFERFFAFGVPDEDVPDATIALALSQIAEGKQADELLRVNAVFLEFPSMIISKMEGRFDQNPISSLRLMRWLAERYVDAPDVGDFVTPSDSVEHFAARVLLSAGPTETAALIVDLAPSAGEFELVVAAIADVMREERRESEAESSEVELRARRARDAVVSQAIEDEFNRRGRQSPLDYPDRTWYAAWVWQLIDRNRSGVWIKAAIDEGRWSLVDTLARFVTTSRLVGVEKAESRVSAFAAEPVIEALGLDVIFEMLDEKISTALSPELFKRLPATPETRRDFALASLKVLRDNRSAPDASAPVT